MGFVVGEMVISCLVTWLLSTRGLEGKEESVGDQTLGQLGWRGENFPTLISSSGIFLPPAEAATPILRWGLSSTPSILDDLWVKFTG